MQSLLLVVKICTSVKVIILSDNYRLPLPICSFISLTYLTHATAQSVETSWHELTAASCHMKKR